MIRKSLDVAPGVAISFVERHPGAVDHTFLLVHGLASNAHTWDGVSEALAAAGCRSLAVDQRGHGESSKPSTGFDFETVTSDLAALVVGEDLGPVVIAGQSWGANVALEFCRRHPELCVAVICIDGGFIRLAEKFPSWDEAAQQLAPPDFSNLTVRDLDHIAGSRFAGWPETGVAGQLANFEQVDETRVRPRLALSNHMQILSALWDHDPDAIADELSSPVLVVAVGHGDADKRARVEAFMQHLLMGELVWAEGDHDIHAEQPELVARLMLDFVGEVV